MSFFDPGQVRGDESARCPVCERAQPASPRYPGYVCAACVERATDAEGAALTFSNADMFGGLIIRGADGKTRDEPRCFIDGRPYRVREARFGGVVVQPEEEAGA